MGSCQSAVLVRGSWRCRSRKQRSCQHRRAWATAPVSNVAPHLCMAVHLERMAWDAQIRTVRCFVSASCLDARLEGSAGRAAVEFLATDGFNQLGDLGHGFTDGSTSYNYTCAAMLMPRRWARCHQCMTQRACGECAARAGTTRRCTSR